MNTSPEAAIDWTLDRGETHPVVLFDGVCNLCDGTVQVILARDPGGTFRFAQLQGAAGQRILRRFALPTRDFDSVVLVHRDRYYQHSSAAIRIAVRFGGLWNALWLLFLVPAFVRDGVYRLIARNRYRWFGQKDVCMMPTPELRGRFLT